MDSSRTEKIIEAIYGIFKNSQSGYQTLQIKGLSFGTMSNTENTIFITDTRLLFVTVPVLGGGAMLGGINVSMMQSTFNSKSIAEHGEQMKNSMTPQAILESDKSNFEIPFDMIKSYKVRNFFGRGITILDTRGQKYTYSIGNKVSLLKLESVLNGKIDV